MRKILLLVMSLMLMTTVLALPYDLEFLKAYVDNDKENSFDEDGGTIDAKVKDEIEIQIKIENNYTEHLDFKYEWIIENIDDGDDEEIDINYFEIKQDEDNLKSLIYTIPSGTDEDEYDCELIISYRYENNTVKTETISFEIDVREEEDEVDELDFYIMLNSTRGMIKTCDNLTNEMANCWSTIDKLEEKNKELSLCKEEKGNFNSQKEVCAVDLQDCRDERSNMVSQSVCESRVQNAKSGMITEAQCESRILQDEEENNSNNSQLLGIGFIVFVIIMIVVMNKRKNRSVTKMNDLTDYPARR